MYSVYGRIEPLFFSRQMLVESLWVILHVLRNPLETTDNRTITTDRQESIHVSHSIREVSSHPPTTVKNWVHIVIKQDPKSYVHKCTTDSWPYPSPLIYCVIVSCHRILNDTHCVFSIFLFKFDHGSFQKTTNLHSTFQYWNFHIWSHVNPSLS